MIYLTEEETRRSEETYGEKETGSSNILASTKRGNSDVHLVFRLSLTGHQKAVDVLLFLSQTVSFYMPFQYVQLHMI